MWMGALVGAFSIGIVLAMRERRRRAASRQCPTCGDRELRRQGRKSVYAWRRGVQGTAWACAGCGESLFEPLDTHFPRRYPGPMTAAQHDAYLASGPPPTAKLLSRRR